MKLFVFLCFVLFVSSDFYEPSVTDIYSVIFLSYSGRMPASDNLYSSLVLFCFLTLKTVEHILILLSSLADVALL